MAVEQDTFASRTVSGTGNFGTASNGDAWSTKINSHATPSVASNEGTVIYDNTTGGVGLLIATLGANTALNFDAYVRFQFNDTGASQDFRLLARFKDTSNYYWARQIYGTNGALQIFRTVGGTSTNLGGSGTHTATQGTKYWARLTVSGTSPTSLKLKVWTDGTAEPAAYQVSVTDSSAALQVTNLVGLAFNATGITTGTGINADSFAVYPPVAPPANSGIIVMHRSLGRLQ